MPIDQYRSDRGDERSRETEKGPVQHPSENNLGTSTIDYFSAKKTKSYNCLPYTCLICHISEQTNKFRKTIFFFFLPTHFVNTYIIDKNNSLEKFESIVFLLLMHFVDRNRYNLSPNNDFISVWIPAKIGNNLS